ncbi:hypothetical protein NDU88_002204 [Pleurodeles waltl]|uniref:Uncharacterized protein n=1 Tax=Pleurodeles waltl TaxID=8319 RepID=A0AAV7WPB7_PLEWA|nr:hypothetical protein NDU88_002204 [Pleurodeles waltl]
MAPRSDLTGDGATKQALFPSAATGEAKPAQHTNPGQPPQPVSTAELTGLQGAVKAPRHAGGCPIRRHPEQTGATPHGVAGSRACKKSTPLPTTTNARPAEPPPPQATPRTSRQPHKGTPPAAVGRAQAKPSTWLRAAGLPKAPTGAARTGSTSPAEGSLSQGSRETAAPTGEIKVLGPKPGRA